MRMMRSLVRKILTRVRIHNVLKISTQMRDAALKRRIDSLEAALGIAGLAMLIGGLLMNNGDESERTASDNVKGCVSLCLPHNFSEYYYGRVVMMN